MIEEIIIAGFGGQGVMSMGQLLAYAGMLENKQVAWIPSYGPEMRGGTANCAVTISDEQISSPLVTEPSVCIVMNKPSLEKFEATIKTGGILFINTSLVDIKPKRQDIKIYEIPANEIANEIGNSKVANMVMLGAVLEITKAVSTNSIIESLKKVLPVQRHNLIPLNASALEKGAQFIN
ncbi:MAG: 2-oxoacid:acceptor oxidoreductase family protein [Bacillota bacterium]